MSNPTAALDIGAKLWSLCHVLRDDGVTDHQYLSELTYLLFLKMMKETGQESRLTVWKKPKKGEPEEQQPGIRWDDLLNASAPDRLNTYKEMLLDYGLHSRGAVQAIYANANTFITKPATLTALVTEIEKLDWYSVQRDDLGDLYEELLERNATEKKSGAGQYFTPRPLIDSIVTLMQPQLDDVIQDPASGTCGFLIAANNYLRRENDFDALTDAQQRKYKHLTYYGMELVQDTHRLALMNMLLHGIEGGVAYGDTLSEDYRQLPPATLILSNPPFGTKKGGGLPTRTDFTYPTANKQFAFLQHIYRALKPGGRAAVVLPDNVLFFTRGEKDKGNTQEVWVYDMRANMPQFGKRTAFTRQHFAEFEAAYGPDPQGDNGAFRHARAGGNPEATRFRVFTREQIAARGDNLDINWLKDDSAETAEAQRDEPALVARLALRELNAAVIELRALLDELGEDPDAELDDLLLDETDAEAAPVAGDEAKSTPA